jgi:hypothetical protein
VVVAGHVVAFGAFTAVMVANPGDPLISVLGEAFVSGRVLLLTVVAAMLAYANDGLAVCWLAVYAPLVAFGVQLPLPGFLEPVTPVEWVLRRLWFPVDKALYYGTLGFVAGAGGRRLVRWLRGESDPLLSLVAWWWRDENG